jgi:F-type H+-transporting ATPase subunit b
VPDWAWTWIFQIINFLILVYLLKRFLYGPILRAIDRREKKIAAHFEAAQEKEQEAARKNEEVDAAKRELDERRESILAEAKAEAERTRDELTSKARAEVDEQLERWRADLERERDAFLDEIERHAGEQVCAVAKQALADLADAELERMMADVLVGRLDEMTDDDRDAFARVVRESGEPVTVATAWELPEDDRGKLAAAVADKLVKDVEVRFETAPEIACGIELRAAGREISWTVGGYVTAVRDALAAMIDEKTKRPEKGEKRPRKPGKKEAQDEAGKTEPAEKKDTDDDASEKPG